MLNHCHHRPLTRIEKRVMVAHNALDFALFRLNA